jgi:hypothetical protein
MTTPSAPRSLLVATGTILAAAAILLPLTGCSSVSTMRFACDTQVNDNILLTIDLAQVNDTEAGQIRQEGGRWFYSSLRKSLGNRIQTVAVKGGCAQTVDLGKARKGYDTLAIIADYQAVNVQKPEGSVVFLTNKKDWQGKSLLGAVHGNYLSVNEAR